MSSSQSSGSGKLNIPQGLIDKTWHLSDPLDGVQQTLWLRQTAGKVGSEKGEGNPHIQIQEDNDFKRHNSCNNTINLLLQIIEFVVFFQRANERFTLSMMHIKGTICNFRLLFLNFLYKYRNVIWQFGKDCAFFCILTLNFMSLSGIQFEELVGVSKKHGE